METTIHLPDELLRRIQRYAASKGLDVSEVIASAILRELGSSVSGTSPLQRDTAVEFPLILGKPESPILTDEQVASALEQESQNEDLGHARSVRR